MMREPDLSRREAIGKAALAAGTVLVTGVAVLGAEQAEQDADEGEGEGEVTPPEDLMREHAVLERLLLVNSGDILLISIPN